VSTGKFIKFIIHEHGIEIDPDRIKSIRNVGPPTCKLEVQKFLGKINYLRRFISNLAGKIDTFTPILRLKNDVVFTWGQNSRNLRLGPYPLSGRASPTHIISCRVVLSAPVFGSCSRWPKKPGLYSHH
jgi:hypothetical protein